MSMETVFNWLTVTNKMKMNKDNYLNKKRLVISMICVSSLTTNICELKFVLANENIGFYVTLICLLAISITLQVSKYYNCFYEQINNLSRLDVISLSNFSILFYFSPTKDAL